MVSQNILLDSDIRDWVVLPLFVIMVAAGLLRFYMGNMLKPAPKSTTITLCPSFANLAANLIGMGRKHDGLLPGSTQARPRGAIGVALDRFRGLSDVFGPQPLPTHLVARRTRGLEQLKQKLLLFSGHWED